MAALRGDDFAVVVVGAGPAGISTALHLLRLMPDLSSDVLVLEKSRHPRKKLCGGGVTPDADRWLDRLEIESRVTTLPLAGTRMLVEDQVVEGPGFRTVVREEFDAELAEAAVRRGVRLAQEERVVSFSRDSCGLLVETTKRTIATQVLVGADGATSLIRRQLGRMLGRRAPSGMGRTLRTLREVSTGTCVEHADRLAIMDFRHTHQYGIQGYAWSFPVLIKGLPWLNLGVGDFGIGPRQAGSLVEAFQAFLAEKGFALEECTLESHPIRWYCPSDTHSTQRVLLVGDAAGTDPLLGEGISYALGYGDIAARAIQRALETDDFGFADFEQRMAHHEVGRRLRQRLEIAESVYCQNDWGVFQSLMLRIDEPSPSLPTADREENTGASGGWHGLRRICTTLLRRLRQGARKLVNKA